MLWVPHFNKSVINTICVYQLLALVHNGCLLLGGPIPIDNMLVHRITVSPYQGEHLADDFMGKLQEKKLANQIKSDFRLVKHSRGYVISSISDGAM